MSKPLFNSELFENVPADDFADSWLPWAWGALGASGKRRKVPARIKNGTLHVGADAHGNDGQMPLSDALKVAAQFPDQVAGIGYCLREDDELLFVDCDQCFDASGELHADVQKMVDMAKPCFVEKSVSGNGIHIIGYGDAIPPRAGHKSQTPNGAEVERYTDRRFVCITGNIIGDPVHKLTSLDDLAEWLTETTFTREVTQPKERLELCRDEEHDVSVALTCLPKLDNKRRQDESEWYRVANGCAEISDDLKEPFEEWSKGAGPEYYCPNDGYTKYEQCLRAPSYSGEPQRGVGTLLAMAAEDAKTEASIIIIEATEKLGRNRTDFKQDAASERAQDFSADIDSLPYPRATNTHAVAFPTEHLPHIPQRFVREVARSVGCSESMPATFALGALSSGVCSAAELIIKSGWVVQPILWVAVVSESGSCKSPVETAWRRSSEYAFSLITSWVLNKPSEIFSIGFDRIRQVKNNAGNIVYSETQKQIRLQDIVFPNTVDDTTQVYTSGLINYIANYMASDVLSNYNQYKTNLGLLSNRLGFKLGGFTEKNKFKLILDSRTPLNKGNVFVPEENYKVFLNKSVPVEILNYSGVIIEKATNGFVIKGYSEVSSSFKYFTAVKLANDPVVNIGGVSENFLQWNSGQTYVPGTNIEFQGTYYRVKSQFSSDASFDDTNLAKLPSLPLTGGRDAIIKKTFVKTNVQELPYGTLLRTTQEVVDSWRGTVYPPESAEPAETDLYESPAVEPDESVTSVVEDGPHPDLAE